ncbi:MAG: glucose-6-phosphate isomerase, partial [Acinetobacter sp.]
MINSMLGIDQNEQNLQQLQDKAVIQQQLRLTDLFEKDTQRFEKFSVHFNQLSFDYSKHRINQETRADLFKFADSKLLKEWIKRLFTEESINYTEGRAAMHWALRLPKDDQDYPELAEQVHQQLDRMYQLVEKIHVGQCRGATGEVIQDVVNIGVGGSDLGPLMVSHALSDYKISTAKPLKIHFVSTMDGSQ